MSTPAIIVLVTVALVSLLTLAVTVLFLVTQVKVLTANLKDLQTSLAPTLADLNAESAEMQRRLERVSTEAAKITPPRASR